MTSRQMPATVVGVTSWLNDRTGHSRNTPVATSSVLRGLERPVPPTTQIGSRFGLRHDPIHGGDQHHSGVDFRAAKGTPITAVADGRVVRASRNVSLGNVVIIDHGSGFFSVYGHLDFAIVQAGQYVVSGSLIGFSGNTGARTTGPHLHFTLLQGVSSGSIRSEPTNGVEWDSGAIGVRLDDYAVDPLPMLLSPFAAPALEDPQPGASATSPEIPEASSGAGGTVGAQLADQFGNGPVSEPECATASGLDNSSQGRTDVAAQVEGGTLSGGEGSPTRGADGGPSGEAEGSPIGGSEGNPTSAADRNTNQSLVESSSHGTLHGNAADAPHVFHIDFDEPLYLSPDPGGSSAHDQSGDQGASNDHNHGAGNAPP
jgi:hypothetical protein